MAKEFKAKAHGQNLEQSGQDFSRVPSSSGISRMHLIPSAMSCSK
jgi:hypothetical protein